MTLVVFDIDSTLADVKHRMPEKRPPEITREEFFKLLLDKSKMIDDPVINETVFIFDAVYAISHVARCHVAIVTARSENLREITEQWLRKNCIYYDSLWLNQNCQDYSKDGKEENLTKLIELVKPEMKIAIDDDCLQMTEEVYKKLGFTMLKVIR